MKRLAALLFGMSVMTGMLSVAVPAQAVDATITGAVSSSNGPVGSGQIEFFESCSDYYPVLTENVVAGAYQATLATGTYKVFITPSGGQGAAPSWHSAASSCDDATVITVSADGSIPLVALAGFDITGSVTTDFGTVHSGTVYFYSSCRKYRNYEETASSSISADVYNVTVPSDDYFVRVAPNTNQSALASWHNEKSTCAEADVVSVTTDATTDLTILAGTRLGGTVTSGHGAVTSGNLYFYASCQDYEDGRSAGSAWFGGAYSKTLAPGSYRVWIEVYDDSGALSSWNGGSATCAGSTAITVADATDTEPLTAKTGVILSGAVTSGKGPVADGTVRFYADCAAYEDRDEVGHGAIDAGTYSVVLPPESSYVAWINPENGSGAVDSWHSNKATCGDAAVISVGAVGLDPPPQNLLAMSGATVTGNVTTSNGPVTSGEVGFYTSCAAYNDGLSTAASIENGQYTVDVPAGTYRVLIEPDEGEAAVESWHSAKATCGKAAVITVSADGTVNLVGSPGSLVNGTVSSARGAIAQGSIDFYATCEDFEDGDRAAATYFSSGDPYEVTLPNGTYRVRVRPSQDEPAVTSWHSAAPTCADSTKVTVSGNGTINLVTAAGYEVTGDVASSEGQVANGGVYFYATCEDYRDYRETSYGDINSGSFTTSLPAGTYRVQIVPDSDPDAVPSWHNNKQSCAQADTVTVSGPTNSMHLVASTGWYVGGTVSRGGKLAEYGHVSFYRTCLDYANHDPVADSWLGLGTYEVSLPTGDYIVGVEFGRYEATTFLWHNGKVSCADANTMTVNASTETANLSVPATYATTGSVTAGGDEVRRGWIEFFDTCEDYQAGLRAGTTNIEDGEYLAYLAAGTYYALIHPDGDAAMSWHSAAGTCGQPITVSGAGTVDLVAAKGVAVTGTVSSSNGPVESGQVEFAQSCPAFDTADSTYDRFTDSYHVNLLPGTYYAFIDTDTGTGGRDSWHSAQSTCAQATAITVGADATVDLVVRPKLGDPQPTPPPPVTPTPPPTAQAAAQSLKKPPAKLKKGKKAKLAKKTTQGAKVTWKTSTKKICTVKRNVVTAKKKGTCKLSAKAPARTGFTAFSKRYTIKVR